MKTTHFVSTFQFPVQVNIDGCLLDYLLTVDETGNVYEAVPAIYDLPLRAQELILGETQGQMDRKVKAYSLLFKYLLPLVLAEQLPSYQALLEPLVKEINRRLREKGMEWRALPVSRKRSTPAEQVRSVFGAQEQTDPEFHKLWVNLSSKIEDLNDWRAVQGAADIIQAYPTIAADFFPAIIPFMPFIHQREIFENLAIARTEIVKLYLLNELNQPACAPYAGGILRALNWYTPGEEIYDAIIQFYEREKDLDEFCLTSLIQRLQSYPTERTKEIGFTILRSNHKDSARFAAQTLLKIGVPESEIVAVITPFFKAADPQISEASFEIFAHALSKDYLPEAEETFDIVVKILSKEDNDQIIHALPHIAKRNGMYKMENQLVKLASSKIFALQKSFLILIYRTLGRQKPDFKFELTPPLLDCFWALIQDQDEMIVQYTFYTLQEIACEQKNENFIDVLLELISHHLDNTFFRVEAMSLINVLLSYVPYNKQIEPLYLAALEKNNDRLKITALLGLRFSFDESFKTTLYKKYKDDPYPQVREIAMLMIEVPPHRDRRMLEAYKLAKAQADS